MKRLIAVLCPLLLMLAAAAAPARADEAVLAAGRAHTERFHAGRFDELWEMMTEEMRAALGSREALAGLRASVDGRFGPEAAVLSETVDTPPGHRVYLRTARHEAEPTPLVTQWVLDGEDRIAGFFVRPVQEPAESRFLDYETKARLRLPFEGAWHVFWGGREPESNYHAVDVGQRFASDFLVVRDGSSHAGDGTSLDDYHCWDLPILAPATGTVVVAVDGLPDLAIGAMDLHNPAGNHVVIDLGDDEYAFLAYLRQGSVEVVEGERVTGGQEIGRCGNSGNTSEPHLHFHLQNTPVLGGGEGLPAFFDAYLADGEAVERGEPVRGQVVEQRAEQ